MKRITTLTLAFLAMVLLALAGCESDSGNNNEDTSVADSGYDVVGSDKADDPKDDTQNGVVCDETGWCCKDNACWQTQDTQDTAGGDASDVGPISCYGDEDCPEALVCSMKAGDICVECSDDWNCDEGDICDNLYSYTCLDGSVLDPFRWLEADWKCTEGYSFGQTSTLEIITWDVENEVVIAKGLPPFADYSTWNFWYEGEILHGFAKTNAGDYESKDFSYDQETNKLSFTVVNTETAESWPWVYELIQ